MSDLTERLNALKNHLERLDSGSGEVALIGETLDRITALEAENARLREALRTAADELRGAALHYQSEGFTGLQEAAQLECDNARKVLRETDI